MKESMTPPLPTADAPSVVAQSAMDITLNGQDYKMGRARLCDYAALAQRLHDERMDAVKRQRLSMDSVCFARTMAFCAAQVPTQADVWEHMNTERGQRFLLWRGVHRYHQDISEAQFNTMLEEDRERQQAEADAIGDPTERADRLGELTQQLFGATGWNAPVASEDEQSADPPTFSQPLTGPSNAPSSAKA